MNSSNIYYTTGAHDIIVDSDQKLQIAFRHYSSIKEIPFFYMISKSYPSVKKESNDSVKQQSSILSSLQSSKDTNVLERRNIFTPKTLIPTKSNSNLVTVPPKRKVEKACRSNKGMFQPSLNCICCSSKYNYHILYYYYNYILH